MKYVFFLVFMIGCTGASQTAQNAVTAAGYQASLEICVDQAKKDVAAGLPPAQVLSAYDACATGADKMYGRVAQ